MRLLLLTLLFVLLASPCLADGVAGAAAGSAAGAASGAASGGVNWDNVVDMGKTQRAMRVHQLEELVDFGGSQNQCKGSTCISRSGGKPSEKFAKTASGGLGRNVFKYGKFMNAAGKLSGWGNLAYVAIQLAQMYKDKQLQNEPALQGPLNEALGFQGGHWSQGDKLQCNGGTARVVRVDPPGGTFCKLQLPNNNIPKCSGSYDYIRVSSRDDCADGWITLEKVRYYLEPFTDDTPGTNPGTDPGTNPGTEPSTEPGNNPETLTNKQLQDFVDKLDELLKENDQLAQDIADALDNIIAKNPQQYLDWAPFSPQEFEDGMLQGKLEDAIQQRESATDPATQKQLDDLIGRLSDRINRNELERQKQEWQQGQEQGQEQGQGQQGQEQGQEEQKPKEDEPKEEFKPPEVPETELKAIDFQPIVDLKGKMMTKFPFKLLTAFGSAITVLVTGPVAPSCEINLGFGDPIVLDLSVLDSTAAFIRGIMSFLIFGACGFACFRMWSRF